MVRIDMMNLKESIELINEFSKEDFVLAKRQNATADQLEQKSELKFPSEFREYMDNYAPINNLCFSGVGNPITLYQSERLSWVMHGYNFNPVENKPIESWNESWFLFADEGADPIIVDLTESGEYSTVYRAIHGIGRWEFGPIADSIGQFLLCAAAVHHAFTGFDLEEAIVDDESGFNLHPECASWLFPFINRYAKKYYDDWLSVFDNR